MSDEEEDSELYGLYMYERDYPSFTAPPVSTQPPAPPAAPFIHSDHISSPDGFDLYNLRNLSALSSSADPRSGSSPTIAATATVVVASTGPNALATRAENFVDAVCLTCEW
jgi:hypothetical protein